MKRGTVLVVALTWSWPAAAQVPAFPGAEGEGMWSEGGRFGTVYEVTSIDDSGPGSFREAVEADVPRIVVFRVSGNIELASSLVIRDPYITIAGQTAPGDGITLKNYGFGIRADHVIVRHLRVRPGDNEGIEIDSFSIVEGADIIVDHCSASWSVDETLSATGEELDRVTVQWSIVSESLHCSVHGDGCHGMGSLIRGGWGNAYSFHHNLYAHNNGRNPRPGNYNDSVTDPDGLVLDFRNNVIYDWGGSYAGYNSDDTSITSVNFVGNAYVAGPDSSGNLAYRESCPVARGHFADNAMNGSTPGDPWSLVDFNNLSASEIAAYQHASAFPTEAVSTDDPATAYQRVLADVGATLPARDAVDQRIIADVQNGTGGIIDDEDDVGGWPDLQSTPAPDDSDHDGMPDDWEAAHGFDPNEPSDGNDDCDGDGYTNIEEYINDGPGGPCSGAGGGGTGGSGGSAGSGGVGASAGGPPGGSGGAPTGPGATGDEDGGCGCRLPTSPSRGMSSAWLLGLAAWAWRRRRASG